MKRRDFFKVTAGVVVAATTEGLLESRSHPLPELTDPDYDKVVTSAFPVEKIGAEDFQWWNLYFPESGGEVRMKGYTHIKSIVATAVDMRGCRVTVMPSGIPYPQGAPEMWFQTPADDLTLHLEPLWLQCQDGVIKADGEARLMVHQWRPKLDT